MNTRLLSSIIFFCLTAVSALPATINAASTSLADVTTALGLSAHGDTVVIPAGSSTWSGSITVTKAVTIQGAGSSLTTITRNNGIMFILTPAVNQLIRITGIGFVQSNGYGSASIEVDGSTRSQALVFLNALRIDHCKFTGGTRAINPNGGVYGVIDANQFLNCNIAVGPIGDDNIAWNNRAITAGTTNSLYVESNTFTIDNSAASEPNQQVYLQNGANCVTRYNTFDGSAYTAGNSIFYDSHGNWPVSGTDYNSTNQNRGQPITELYSNTFTAHHTYLFNNWRGGSSLIFSNTFTYATGGAPDALLFTEEESWQTALFNPLRTVYPAMDQITNTFIWSNTLNSAPINAISDNHSEDATFIQENRDYWMHAPQSGQAYFPYTPLAYPHPLAAPAQSTSGLPPSIRRRLTSDELKSLKDEVSTFASNFNKIISIDIAK